VVGKQEVWSYTADDLPRPISLLRRSATGADGQRGRAAKGSSAAAASRRNSESGVATRAVTIDAPRAAVWPWIAQMGPAPRGGAYTHDWIENLLGLDTGSCRSSSDPRAATDSVTAPTA
jgi:hypothetical protein